MILSRDNPEYINLPGIGVLLGGMWIMNISYWGFNQYIVQRALGAKSIAEAQKGILFAALLKMLVLAPELSRPDQAYPEMMKLAPQGIRGLIFAALIAAIVSSIGSMINSIATIFTMDLVKPLFAKNASEQRLVTIGRTASFTALVIALLLATPLLSNSPQVFQNIQNWTGFFTPGVVAIFTLGLFWKRATESGGLIAVIASVLLSLVWPRIFPDMPFLDRIGLVFLISLFLGVISSFLQPRHAREKVVELRDISFSTEPAFNIGALVITAMLIGLYAYWW